MVTSGHCLYRPRSEGDNALGSVRLSVCLGVPRAHYTPLQRYIHSVIWIFTLQYLADYQHLHSTEKYFLQA